MKSRLRASLYLGLTMSLAACAVDNTSGRKAAYQDPDTPGAVAGVGIEGQDIVSMTDQMMRDMLASPRLATAKAPPQVILDGQYFSNESSQRINKNLIVDRLRIELQRAAAGRIMFVAREHADMVAMERDLKRAGQVDLATTGLTRVVAGADYRLGGRISSLDSVDRKSGMAQRYNQITFELIDLESGLIVWSNLYEFKKAAQDDVVYR